MNMSESENITEMFIPVEVMVGFIASQKIITTTLVFTEEV